MSASQLQSSNQQMERRQKLEQIFAAACLERDVYHREHELKVRWPEDLALAAEITLRLQTPGGRIYGELQPFFVRPGAVANLGKVNRVPDGAYQIVVMPRLEEYYEQGMKIQRRIDLQIANGPFSTAPYGAEEQRRREALDEAARRGLGLFTELAKMALERWAQVKPAVIEQAIAALNQHPVDGADQFLGLLGMMARFGADPHFPAHLQPQGTACVLGFNYGAVTSANATAGQQILAASCTLLAGQLYPEQTFVSNGQLGTEQQAQGEAQALAWLHARARGGFALWDASSEIDRIVLALTHLADWATNDQVAELAAVMLDKLFFTLAINSQRGVFGFAGNQGRIHASASLARLLWGLGAFNSQINSTVSLAVSGYQLPPIIAQLAADQPTASTSHECHQVGPGVVSKVAYQTPDYLLCSLLDYCPGQRGDQQQIWQATFGPDAVVFVNQPAVASPESGQQSQFWQGNALLPRVAQRQDVLVAIHKVPADGPGFTHAYFPTAAFDESVLREGWAFASSGSGYLALRASGELQLISTGVSAGRELRVTGPEQTWFLHLGRAAQDGTFAEFQAKILALAIRPEPLALHADTLRGETIDFGWDGPLLVNEIEQPLSTPWHYANAYCTAEPGAELLEIRFGDELLRLDFSSPRELKS